MSASLPQIAVAGHICLDVIPDFPAQGAGLGALIAPGALVELGPATHAAGGAVANTGLALHRLGVPVLLMGKLGDDTYGSEILGLLGRHDETLTRGMTVAEGEHTSYSIVLSPPGVDRIFLHHTGANSTFCADDVNLDHLEGVRFFHFGYPPLMRRMYLNGGREMAALFRQVKQAGLFTSLDMAMPDPAAEVGRIDWRDWLARVLPHVDLFAPSLDEILFMLHGRQFGKHSPASYADVAQELIDLGAALVALKLGDKGLYLRSTANPGGLGKWLPPCWSDRELLAPCFQVEVAGTTGAGDCTVAGFLAGISQGASLMETVTLATAVGACSVETPDSTSGIPNLDAVQRRIYSGWPRRVVSEGLSGWSWNADHSVWHGPNDLLQMRS